LDVFFGFVALWLVFGSVDFDEETGVRLGGVDIGFEFAVEFETGETAAFVEFADGGEELIAVVFNFFEVLDIVFVGDVSLQ
jgi:hypothetical protein